MSWTMERVDCLKALWADGLSASQIAGELGGVSRSAVIGKVHRLGLEGRSRGVNPVRHANRQERAPAVPGRRPGRPPRLRGQTAALAIATQAAPAPVPQFDNVIPFGQRRTLLELTDETCRWPIGDPQREGFFFCGGAPLAGVPYCAHHTREAYNAYAEFRRRA